MRIWRTRLAKVLKVVFLAMFTCVIVTNVPFGPFT